MAKSLPEVFLYRCAGCRSVHAWDFKRTTPYGWCGSCRTNAIMEPVAIDFKTRQFVVAPVEGADGS